MNLRINNNTNYTRSNVGFGQKPPLELGSDMRLIAKKVKWGNLKLDEVHEAIKKELLNPNVPEFRKSKLTGLKQMLDIKA